MRTDYPNLELIEYKSRDILMNEEEIFIYPTNFIRILLQTFFLRLGRVQHWDSAVGVDKRSQQHTRQSCMRLIQIFIWCFLMNILLIS